MKKDEDKIAKANEAITILMGAPPILEFEEPVLENDAMMNHGLAQMYANEGFRKFLVNEYNRAIKSSVTRTESLVDVAFAKARILTFKEILVKSRRAYMQLEKINSLLKKKNDKEKQIA